MSEPFYRPETKEAWDEVQRVNRDLAKQRDTLGSDLASMQLRAEQSENREEVLQLEFIDMRNRAKLAEKSALDFKAIADHLQRQRAESEAAHGRICDDKNKEIADLQARMTRYERLLEDAEGNAETLRKAYAEAKYRADNTTRGKIITDLQNHLSAHQKQIAACERENERLRAVIEGIQNLLSLAE